MRSDLEHDDTAETFWPGYVDAVTNLVLNLLFLLTIMTVAVFMFALELGRASLGGAGKTQAQAMKPDEVKQSNLTEAEAEALRKQIEELQKELRNKQAIIAEQSGTLSKIVPATAAVSKPLKGVERTFTNDAEVIVRFTDEAVTLTKAEQAQLRDALKGIVARGKARISVEVPKGFTEAKRLGFYRSVAVRNLLIEMKLPKEKIEVAVTEGRASANAAIVRVITPE